MTPIRRNTLFYGDNLAILREYIPDESIDLIYLDPPFNSSRSYNVLFRDESGRESDAQITAFEDTWHWDASAAHTYHELITDAPHRVSAMIAALHDFIGENQMMAYLVMMTARLVELHRVLKPTGSLYLHCDPTASHYLKIILDTIFGPERFISEIVWKRTSAHSSAKRPGPVHDTILFYSKTNDYTWNDVFTPYDQSYTDAFYRHVEESTGRRYRLSDLTGAGIRRGETGLPWRGIDVTSKGRHWMNPPSDLDKLDEEGRIYWPSKGTVPAYKRYLDEMPGVPLQDIWTDIDPIAAQAAERLGYPTQKPLSLLERIIQASSNPGDWILDPFCGCGTAIAAAQALDRHWIGIDITYLAISLQKYRLKDAFKLEARKDYQVIGEPVSIHSARQLSEDDRFQFQWWACGLVDAKPLGGDAGSKRGKKGADRGIDGVINFIDEKGKPKNVIIQIKSGHVSSRDIRDLRGVLEREDAPIGIFITLEPATSAMEKEALAAGFYHSQLWQKDYPKIQILTIEQLLNGAGIDMPPQHGTFRQAERVKKEEGTQGELGI